MPIADSALGGSHLWLKGSAQLNTGGAGPGGEDGRLAADPGMHGPGERLLVHRAFLRLAGG